MEILGPETTSPYPSSASPSLRWAWTLLEREARVSTLSRLRRAKLRHKQDRQHQLWQEGSHPKALFSEEMLVQKLEYAHDNPVRRGYVDEAEHWYYSIARDYAGRPGRVAVTMDW